MGNRKETWGGKRKVPYGSVYKEAAPYPKLLISMGISFIPKPPAPPSLLPRNFKTTPLVF
jgi:hypothetical protein